MTDKIYCGNGKEIKTKYGSMLKLSLHKDDVDKLVDNLDNDWVNVLVSERREPSEKGMTHYLTIDEWKPEVGQNESPSVEGAEEVDIDDLNF